MKSLLFLAAVFLSTTILPAEKATPVTPTPTEWTTLALGQSFPEGPSWDGMSILYFSNCNGGNVSRISAAGPSPFARAADFPKVMQKTNGTCVGAAGDLYVCEYGLGSILRISGFGVPTPIATGYRGMRFNRPNDIAFAPSGHLYFTDPKSYGPAVTDGRVFFLRAGSREVVLAREGFSFPNGLCFSADGKTLYLAESGHQRVLTLAVGEDGTLGEPTVFAEMPGGDPDGMNLDTEGNLWVAHFGGGAVRVYSPKGELLRLLATPGKKPSNLDFGGSDMKTLFLTEDETNGVYRVQVEATGLPLFRGTM